MAKEPSQGTPVQQTTETRKKFDFNHLNTLAVVSFATALTSIGAIGAIVMGHISLAQLKRSGESGRGFALAGVVIGYVTVASWLIGGLFLVILGSVIGDQLSGEFPMRMDGPWGWDK